MTQSERNNQDYIRSAVELADGFEWDELKELGHSWVRLPQPFGIVEPLWVKSDEKFMLDAVAAQLARQVDALNDAEDYPRFILLPFRTETILQDTGRQDTGVPQPMTMAHKGEGRTMNTIKVVVDSDVLKPKDS